MKSLALDDRLHESFYTLSHACLWEARDARLQFASLSAVGRGTTLTIVTFPCFVIIQVEVIVPPIEPTVFDPTTEISHSDLRAADCFPR